MYSKSLLAQVLKQQYHCSENVEKHLQQRLKLINPKKEEVIEWPNEVCKRIYFIESGYVRTFAFKHHKQLTIDFAGQGQFCILAESFMHQQKSSYGLCCESDCQLYSLHYDDLMVLSEDMAAFAWLSSKILIEHILQLQQRIMQERYAPPQERLQTLLQRYPELIRYAQRKHLASYLGVAPASLNRMLHVYFTNG